MEIVIASGNKHKQDEIIRILDLSIKWIIEPDIDTILKGVETGSTFYENAVLKAVTASKHSGKSALADDSGLEVFSLDGAPGIFSSRYAGENATDKMNVDKLLQKMESLTDAEDRKARFVCVTVLAFGSKILASAEGECSGKIVFQPKGSRGFGYDPIFQPDGHDKTMGELEPNEKNRISHRGGALRKLRSILRVGAHSDGVICSEYFQPE